MINNKKGSYIVEAAVSLPVLIIAICSLILIIRIAMVCESICFSTADSLKEIIRNPQENFLSVSLCKKIEENVLSDELKLTSFAVEKIDYIVFDDDETEHIAIEAVGRFVVNNPIGIAGNITFEESLAARPMVGQNNSCETLSELDFSEIGKSQKVVVFPKYGKKYHTKECTYVKRAKKDAVCQLEMEKIDAGLKAYEPCLVCGGAAK